MIDNLPARARKALLTGTREAGPSVAYDERGYAARWQDNLMPGLPLTAIELDFNTGAGRELGSKLRAAHSSAALAVNTFGPWFMNPTSLNLAGAREFR
jgi:hypothetical protein